MTKKLYLNKKMRLSTFWNDCHENKSYLDKFNRYTNNCGKKIKVQDIAVVYKSSNTLLKTFLDNPKGKEHSFESGMYEIKRRNYDN